MTSMRKRKTPVKAALLLCSATLALSVLAGCNSGGTAAPSNSPAAASPSTSAPATPAEPFKLSLFLIQDTPENPKPDNPILSALEAATNTKLSITWVPAAQIDEKTNLILASGNMPQLMFIQSLKSPSILNAIRAGAFWEMGPYFKEFPNLNKANPDILKNMTVDGKNYGVYKYAAPAQVGVAYRADWLDNVGLKAPATVDEFYNMLKAFKTQDPDKNGKDDTYGMVYYKESFLAMFRIIALWHGSPNIWGEDQNGNLIPDFMTANYMDGMKFMKKLYDEKLINQDFAVVTNANANDMFLEGSGGSVFASSSSIPGWQNSEKIKNQKGQIGMIGTVEGGHGLRARAGGGYVGTYMIPKQSVKTEGEFKRVMQFLDDLNTTEVQDLLVHGIEGRHYTKENGLIVNTPDLPEGQKFANEVLSLGRLHVRTANNESPVKLTPAQQLRDDIRAANEKVAIYNLAEPYESETYTKQGQQLDNLRYDMMVKFVMGQIDEAGYQAEVNKWLNAGGTNVIKEFNDQYQANKKK